MTSSRHAQLRASTSAVHLSVERAVEAAGYFAGLAQYGSYLQRWHLFHRRLSAALDETGCAMASRWRMAERVTWLADDLAALEIQPLAPSRQASPLSGASFGTRAARFGVFYVVLGSALGARLLREQARILPLPDGRGLTYLDTLATSRDWGPYLAALEQEPDLSADELDRGAHLTFESVLDHLAGAHAP